LARTLRSAGFRLVVLNSCDTAHGGGNDGFASSAITLVDKGGLPAVLAMQYAISDAAAKVLASVFYKSLADGLPVDAAVTEARKAMSNDNPFSLEWATPVLIQRTPDGVLFDIQRVAASLPEPAVLPVAPSLPAPNELDVAASASPLTTPRSEKAPPNRIWFGAAIGAGMLALALWWLGPFPKPWQAVPEATVFPIAATTSCDAIHTTVGETASADRVPMFRGNASRTGQMLGPGPERDPVDKWTYRTRGEVFSSPAVVSGTIYFGSYDGMVYAVDAETGTQLWAFPTGSPVRSSPAVDGRMVYVGSNNGNVYALDANTGEKQWQFPAKLPVFSSPSVMNGVVYVGSGSTDQVDLSRDPTKDAGIIFALDAKTGTERWSFSTPGIVLSSPAISGNMVFFGSWDGGVYALNAESGQECWHFPTSSTVLSSPAVADGVVYVGSYDGNVYALDANTGEKRWHRLTGGLVYSSPAVAAGVVYVGSFDGYLYAVDAATGRDRWEPLWLGGQQRDKPSEVRSSPAVVGDTIYVGSNDGHVYAVDATRGTILWQFPTGGEVRSSPTVANGTVYVGSQDSKLWALVSDTVGSPSP
jgi:outer membrane protein assembly factor BamB